MQELANTELGARDARGAADKAPAPIPAASKRAGSADQSRLIVWLYVSGFVVAVMIVAGTVLMLANLRDRQLSETSRELQNLALSVGEQINGNFGAVGLVQKSLSEPLEALQLTTPGEFERFVSGHAVHLTLKDKISGLPFIAALAFVSADGKLLCTSAASPPPVVDVRDRDYSQALMSNPEMRTFIGVPVQNKVLGVWAIHAVRAVRGPDSQLLGFVLATIELRQIEKSFAAITLRRGGSIALMRDDGILFARYPRVETSVGQIHTSLLTKLGSADRAIIHLVSSIDAVDRIVAAQRLARFPLVIAVGVETSAALAAWRETALSVLAAAGALMLVIVVIILAGARQVATRLRSQNEQFDTAINNMSQGLCLFDRNHRLVVSNDRYAQMYGLSPDQVAPGTSLVQLLEARRSRGTFIKDLEPRAYVQETIPSIDSKSSGARITELSDGRHIVVYTRPMPDGGWVATHDDISERHQLNARLETNLALLGERTSLLQAIIDNFPGGIGFFDRELRVVICNDRAKDILDLPERFFEHGPPLLEDILRFNALRGEYGPGDVEQQVASKLALAKDRTTYRFERERPDGTVLDVRGKPIDNGGFITTYMDITERYRSEAKIAHMARHDELTGLPNRVLLNERLDFVLTRVSRGEMVAVHLLDLDRFKAVNDTLGHPTGDKLLRLVADRLRPLARETDIIARMGGDEFAIVQVALGGPADATALAHRVIDALSRPYDIDGREVVIGTSIGIAMAPGDGLQPEVLIRNADLSLYQAKGNGRGTFCFFEPGMDARMQARHAMEIDLRNALAGGQFELHYQPMVGLDSNDIRGFEALIRWHHPQNGTVPPDSFIPLAEETGLIIAIGEWTLREACVTAAKWPGNLRVAVNLSPSQFRSPALPSLIVSALAKSGLAPERLELEINEMALWQDMDDALDILYRLRGLGVRIAMDDFGTGHSSLNYLQSFPFDRIKIDRSFVKDIAGDGSLVIVRAIAMLAHGLAMETTVEGVEDKEQLAAVKAEGCTEMQGFLFSRALPSSEIESLFLADLRPAAASQKPVAA